MQWRRISEEEVMQVLNSPDQVEPSTKGRMNVFKTVGAKYLKVTYRESAEELLVISVVNKA
jgi:uncharacterized protein (DUF433 family)/uncharacterized protein YuzE